jgi:Phage integrase, N-terminal SAM-like domain
VSPQSPDATPLRGDAAAFLEYLRGERGLADNTLLAYGRDLAHFAGGGNASAFSETRSGGRSPPGWTSGRPWPRPPARPCSSTAGAAA